ncbi:MAG: transglycosylase SLT domain-containing protein [Candidatus Thiodiazotropha sp. (ex Lucinoma borealis)]|nr:transglycosylase SLT domain-containing protein [Candidatus Thiodiazotropha sp. (ex Lucinoma borealis)]
MEASIFHLIGQKYDIDPRLLFAIALNESGRNHEKGYITPHPYVFRTYDGAHYFDSVATASAPLLARLKKTTNIDIGMMQINLRYHPVDDPLRLLEPVFNLEIAAKYLKKTLSSTNDSILGIGRYHSWKPLRARWYGRKVNGTYLNLQKVFPLQKLDETK